MKSARLPPLVCGLQKWNEDRVCWGVDVVRCRKNGLANARFPLPVFCPLDSVQEVREGHLADLTYVKLRKDGRVALLARLPSVGEGWCAKPACAHMLEAGVATWQDFLWSLDATAHVDPSCLAWALRKMEEAWPEEHLAKLSVNALIGLWARNVDLVYLMRTSNNQLDGHGCQRRQTFVDAAGQMRWDHIFVTQLFSNASRRPAWDFVMAAEYCAVARIRQMLAEVPMRYLKFLKTDCLGLQDLPKKYWPAVERLTRLRHPTACRLQVRGRAAAGPPLRAGDPGLAAAAPRLGASRGAGGPLPAGAQSAAHRVARRREDAPCEAHRGAAAGGRRCGAAGNLGLGAQTADHWVRRTVRNGRCQLDWLVIEMDTGLWADVACVALDRGVRVPAHGRFPAAAGGAGQLRWARVEPLKDSDLLRDLCHELTENRRSDERIFQFISWLRVGKPRRCLWPRL